MGLKGIENSQRKTKAGVIIAKRILHASAGSFISMTRSETYLFPVSFFELHGLIMESFLLSSMLKIQSIKILAIEGSREVGSPRLSTGKFA